MIILNERKEVIVSDGINKEDDDEFKPCSKGCAERCPIEKDEIDICCSTARQCCYFCFEQCPIKEEYNIKTNETEIKENNQAKESNRNYTDEMIQ